MEVRTREEAWEAVNKMFPTDYQQDTASSERAGYPVYRSTADGVNAWISDLNCRLEVNIQDEKTKKIASTNIYIVNKEAEEIESLQKQIEEMKTAMKSLVAEYHLLKTDNEFLQDQRKKDIQEGSRLYKEIDALVHDNDRLKKENEEKDNQIIRLKAKLYELLVTD